MLGDSVKNALSLVGVTEQRVTKWLGKPCNCPSRVERLNALEAWARRVIKGHSDKAKEYLADLLRIR